MLFQCTQLDQQEQEVIAKIDKLRLSLRYSVQSGGRWSGAMRRTLEAENIRGSNSIENIHIEQADALALLSGTERRGASVADWKALRGYRRAMTYVLQLADDPSFRYSGDLLRALHFMMTEQDLTKHPGRWRPGAIFVRDEAREVTVYEGPDAELVPDLIDELVDSLNEKDGLPAMARAAMAHLNLVMIHPFSDGNGRMSRCLQTLVLERENVLEPPFCSIEEYLGRHTSEYYAVLAEVSKGHWSPCDRVQPWMRFNLTAHYRQALRLQQQRRFIERLWNRLEEQALREKLPERVLTTLTNAAMGYRVTNNDHRHETEVSAQVASRDLSSLTRHGFLAARGDNRGRFYVASPSLIELRIACSEPLRTVDPFEQTTLPFQS